MTRWKTCPTGRFNVQESNDTLENVSHGKRQRALHYNVRESNDTLGNVSHGKIQRAILLAKPRLCCLSSRVVGEGVVCLPRTDNINILRYATYSNARYKAISD